MCCQTVSTYISTKGHDLGEKQALKKGEPVSITSISFFFLANPASSACLSS